MIEITDEEAIELYNKIKQFILNSKNHEYSEQDDKEVGKVIFINKDEDEITVGIKCYQSSYDYKKTYIAYILTPNRYVDGYHTIWKLNKDSCEVEYGYGWDFDEYYVVTSREVPEDILKPFRKKIHRPKKATKKVYIENPVINNGSIVEELTEAYKHYYSATQKKDEITKEKESKIREAIEEIAAQYKKEINNSTLEVKNTKTKLDEYDSLVTKYSTFNVDLIGEAIARIISALTNKKYIYDLVENVHEESIPDLMGEPYQSTEREYVYIIVEGSKHEKHYRRYELCENAIDELVKSKDAILLSDYKYCDDNITLLTSQNGEISFNIDLDNYEYIRDFIMELVQYRFQRKLDKFTKEDMNLCVERFIEKSEGIKIQKRILTLQKELDTLTSKLNS